MSTKEQREQQLKRVLMELKKFSEVTNAPHFWEGICSIGSMAKLSGEGIEAGSDTKVDCYITGVVRALELDGDKQLARIETTFSQLLVPADCIFSESSRVRLGERVTIRIAVERN